VPRINSGEREARDALVFAFFVAGQPYRQIGRHPAVRLSVRGVRLAVRRRLAAAGGVARLEAMFADAYWRSCDGDERAGIQLRRLGTLLGRLEGLDDAAGETAVDATEPRREGVLVVPVGTPRDVVASLARERAATLLGEGEAVGDVRLEASREYDTDVEWSFTFEVLPPPQR
jgi:hypothetical protein